MKEKNWKSDRIKPATGFIGSNIMMSIGDIITGIMKGTVTTTVTGTDTVITTMDTTTTIITDTSTTMMVMMKLDIMVTAITEAIMEDTEAVVGGTTLADTTVLTTTGNSNLTTLSSECCNVK